MQAFSAPRREFGWTRIRAAPNESAMGECKRSAELLPVPMKLAALECLSPEAQEKPEERRKTCQTHLQARS